MNTLFKSGADRSVTNCTLLFRPKEFFFPIDSHWNPVTETTHPTSLTVKHHNYNSVSWLSQHRKFCRNRSLKVILLLRSKHSFVRIAQRIAAGRLRQKHKHSLPALYKLYEFGGKRSVTNGTLLLRPNQFLLALTTHCWGATERSNVVLSAHGLQERYVCSKLVCNKGHFTLEGEGVFPPSLLELLRGGRDTTPWISCPWSKSCASFVEIC
jgi:hypothetical protein